MNIGSGNVNNRPIIGGGNNIANRPGWGNGGYSGCRQRRLLGWKRQGWGNAWANGFVNGYHRGWYHGAWSGNRANNWYVPLVYGATGWGLGALSNTWGYGYNYGYANPYYSAAAVGATPYYDYSQPIVINSYADAPVDPDAAAVDATGGQPAQPRDDRRPADRLRPVRPGPRSRSWPATTRRP